MYAVNHGCYLGPGDEPTEPEVKSTQCIAGGLLTEGYAERKKTLVDMVEGECVHNSMATDDPKKSALDASRNAAVK